MANHNSSKKRIRQTEIRRVENRYYAVTMRNALKKIRDMKNKAEALEFKPKVEELLDKLAGKGVIHKNKASNLKSKVAKHIANLS